MHTAQMSPTVPPAMSFSSSAGERAARANKGMQNRKEITLSTIAYVVSAVSFSECSMLAAAMTTRLATAMRVRQEKAVGIARVRCAQRSDETLQAWHAAKRHFHMFPKSKYVIAFIFWKR
eukprot:6177892-Pleurochrysis_carterae.AAC.1